MMVRAWAIRSSCVIEVNLCYLGSAVKLLDYVAMRRSMGGG